MLSPAALDPGAARLRSQPLLHLAAADTHFFTCSTASGSRRHAARSKATDSSAVASVRTSGVYPTRIPLEGKHRSLGQRCQPWGATSKLLGKLLMLHLFYVSAVPCARGHPFWLLSPSSEDSSQPQLGWGYPSLSLASKGSSSPSWVGGDPSHTLARGRCRSQTLSSPTLRGSPPARPVPQRPAALPRQEQDER